MKLNLSGTTLIQQLILQIIIGLIVAANPGIVKAQLTPDNTVGSTTRSDTVKGLNSDIIEGGATRGTNLFHSFTNFNVDAGRGVYFSNPADINNILTRVTGSSQSNIFGTLGVLGNANLFLINPNGISFGPNAQLDVKGSFVASTADKIVFDNYQFTTTNPTAPPLLTVNIPLGLGFRNNPGDINVNPAGSTLAFNNGQGLKVPEGKTLALIGGNVNINGNGVHAQDLRAGILSPGSLRAGILSPGSRVQLGGLTQTGTVNFNENFYSTFPQGVTRGNVSLSNGAEINVRAAGGGSITINSRNLNVNGNSRVRGGIQKNLGSANAQAGNIEINNIEQVTLDNAVIANIVDEFGKGNAGDINIHSSSLTLKNGGTINTNVFTASSEGNAGNVTIDTANLTLENGGFIIAITSGKGNAGNIAIKATQGVNVRGFLSSGSISSISAGIGDINIKRVNDNNIGSQINTGTSGKGNAGDIDITASNITIDDQGFVSSFVDKDSAGKGGNITITTSNLTLKNGGFIDASTNGIGHAGNIDITAKDSVKADVKIDGFSRILSNVESGAKGNAGNIKIDLKAGSLSLTNGGGITSLIRGYETLPNGTIVKQRGEGNGGKITIKAGDINIKGVDSGNNIGSQINTGTSGKGNAGDIDITASNITIDDQGFVGSFVDKDSAGKGGNIAITTSNLTLKNGSSINTDTSANGDAGNIKLDITDNLKLTNSNISSGATSDSTGKAGDINIDPTLIELNDGSQITVNSQGSGDGGNITLIGDNLNLNNSTISASTKSGQGGNITLNIPDTIRQNNSKIEASAGENGNGGNVTINTKFIIGNSSENRISTNAKQGAGGNIKITTQGIFGYKDNQISASSETGVNGVVDTKTPEVDPSQGLIDLPENLLTAAIVTNSCRQGQNSQNSLIVKGRGGLALTSDQLPSSSEVEVSLIAPTSVTSSSAINSRSANMEKTAFKTIVPAQGWEINSQGDVVLVAHSTGNPAERVNTAITCASN
jgi:filamentous hemagglutinin family protein